MNRRLELHKILCDILGSDNVYFQPPENIKMNYPAIIYGVDSMRNAHADDRVYLSSKQYSVIVIDKNPESEITTKLCNLRFSKFNRHYEKDNLNHDVFTLFY